MDWGVAGGGFFFEAIASLSCFVAFCLLNQFFVEPLSDSSLNNALFRSRASSL